MSKTITQAKASPDFLIKLRLLKKDLLGDYAGAANHCKVSVATVQRQLGAVYIDHELIGKLIEYRDIKAAERLQKEKELSKRISPTT